MSELAAPTMNLEIAFVLLVVVAALVLFAVERYRVDQVALTIPVVLLVAGVIGPSEAIHGFAHTATVTVAAMIGLSVGLVKTGAVGAIGRWAKNAPLGGPKRRLVILCLIVAGLSPFLNNTPVVVIFIPVFLAVAQKVDEPPSKYMIPLSYAAILGGTVTLIGTSTNLIVYGIAEERGLEGLSMFSIAPLGLISLAVGLVYLFTIGRMLLPARPGQTDLSRKYDVRRFVTELTVTDDSSAAGQSLADLRWGETYGVAVLGIHREGRTIWGPGTRRRIRVGDVLYAQGHHDDLFRLARQERLHTRVQNVGVDLAVEDAHLAEVLVGPSSPIVGQTLKDVRFQQRYDVTVLAIQHFARTVRVRLADIRLMSGDLLLVHGTHTALQSLIEDQAFVPISAVDAPREGRQRAPVALAILAGVVIVAGLGILPIMAAAITGLVLMLFTRCMRIDELYQDMDWMVVFLLAGVIPLGIAMDQSGAAMWLGHHLSTLVGPYGPTAVIAAFYLFTAILTSVMSNNATAVVLTPIALLTADQLGINPMALVVSVMFGASAGFMTPISYQTNTLVYGPGGYRFVDFLKVGAPLNLLLAVTAAIFIPMFWPS